MKGDWHGTVLREGEAEILCPIAKHLDRLKQIGVQTLWFMPNTFTTGFTLSPYRNHATVFNLL